MFPFFSSKEKSEKTDVENDIYEKKANEIFSDYEKNSPNVFQSGGCQTQEEIERNVENATKKIKAKYSDFFGASGATGPTGSTGYIGEAPTGQVGQQDNVSYTSPKNHS